MVRPYFRLASGEWIAKEVCSLEECFPSEPEMVLEARASIYSLGVYFGGGGAAPEWKLEAVG
jgi:hypothetical protein